MADALRTAAVRGRWQLAAVLDAFRPGDGVGLVERFRDSAASQGHAHSNPRLRAWLVECEYWRADADEYLELGDYVVVLATYHGRGRESGAEIHQEGAHVSSCAATRSSGSIFATRARAIESVQAARADRVS